MEHFYPTRAPAPPAPPAPHNSILGCCHHHDHFHEIFITQVAILERLLQKFEEQSGMPKGDPFSFAQNSPVQNQIYTSQPAGYNGVIRSLVICGPGNVTLGINNPAQPVGGFKTICQLTSNAASISVPHHIRIPVGATFTLATDAAAGTGLLSMSAWIEPISLEGNEQYRLRR